MVFPMRGIPASVLLSPVKNAFRWAKIQPYSCHGPALSKLTVFEIPADD